MQQFGKYIIFAGIILVIIGAIMWLFFNGQMEGSCYPAARLIY